MKTDVTTLGAAALAADYAEDLVLGTVREVHGAVAGRLLGISDRLNGGGPTITHRLHDGISWAVYSGIGAGLRAGSRALRAASRAGLGAPLETDPRGRFVQSAVNGLIGDRLRDEGSEFAFDMAVRVDGRDVVPDPPDLAEAFPGATGNLVVFVHGLSENEEHWRRAARPRREAADRRSYGDRLVADGWTPVYVRVNTGYPISENGVAMAALLERLVEAWSTDVRRIALVGHSMGGLILRAACAVRTDRERPWTDRVTDVVCLGTPHLGAPLERVVDKGVRVLGVLPESAPFGRILEYRSVGILDLRHGLAGDVQNLHNARYRLVAATLTRSERSLTSGTVGDYLVPYASAIGRRRGGEEMFPGADIVHVPRADHFDLLNHDDVYAAIREWLCDRSDRPTQEHSAGG